MVDMKLCYIASQTKCSQCSQEYKDKQSGWIYHSTYRSFTCSKECRAADIWQEKTMHTGSFKR